MYKVKLLDNLSEKGLATFDSAQYQLGTEIADPDILLVRSRKLQDYVFPEHVIAVGRAGIGTDNIPVERLTKQGIPVFFAPGANANAVKELVIAALLIGYRNLNQARYFLDNLALDKKDELNQEIETGKKQFVGHEIYGKTLGVIGLGNIGCKVANAALSLGMNVVAYDPFMTLTNALALMPGVKVIADLNQCLSSADIVTLHIPLRTDTTCLINEKNMGLMKKDALLMNFSREKIVSEEAIIEQLNNKLLMGYITDFPTPNLATHPRVLSFPHLGASTTEAESNSAEMVIRNISNYLEYGIIEHSINFPDTSLPTARLSDCCRMVVINHNKPGVIADCTQKISQLGYNIERMVNTSRDTIAVNLIDISGVHELRDELATHFKAIESVIRVYIIPSAG